MRPTRSCSLTIWYLRRTVAWSMPSLSMRSLISLKTYG
ncbi:Uncharacterised protein [Bordetella pertussis]|nr:Uncharacterised protein [Bordetella pertussis]